MDCILLITMKITGGGDYILTSISEAGINKKPTAYPFEIHLF
jgi:hypothetical protein